MANRDDCIADILRAAGGKRTRTEAESILDQIDEDAQRYGRDGASPGEAYAKARDRMLDQEARRAAVLRRATRLDAAKAHDIGKFATAVKNAAQALGLPGKWASMAGEAVLVGLDRPIFDKASRWGSRRSAEAIGLGFRNKVFTFVERELRDLERADSRMTGLYDEMVGKKNQDNIFREMWQIDDPRGGRPGITKDVRALAIAKVMHQAETMRISALNAEGAWIADRKNHAFKNSTDPDRARVAGNTKWWNGQGRHSWTEDNARHWVGDAMLHLDTAKMFPGQEADQALRRMYPEMVTGNHLEFTGPQDPNQIVQNTAKHVSERRVLIFKSADDMLSYNKKYGRFDPTDTWSHSMVEAGRQIGLMKIFGTRPKEGFENYMAALKNAAKNTPAELDLQAWDSKLRTRYAFVSGDANRPVSGLWRRISNGIMAVQRLSKLGLTPFAMMQDNSTVSRELSRQGLKVWERNGSMLTDYFQGGIDSDKQKVAELTYAGLMGDLHANASRFDTSDAAPGALAKAEQYFFKWTGISAMTENKRQNAIRMMSRHWGMLRGEDFSALGERERNMMQNYGIGDAEWKLLNTVEWHDLDGVHLTPDVVDKISDADMTGYLKGRGVRNELVSGGEGKPMVQAPWSAEALQSARDDLGLSLHSYLADRGNYAVIEVGARERAMIYGASGASLGFEPGSVKGEAMRLLMQFKQFPTAMITRGWMADLRGLKGMGRITGLVELAVSSTLFGMGANFLNSIAKGQDPTAQWRNQPAQALIAGFTRGGTGSIYGDFLLGEWSRFQSFAETALGPTFGQVNRIAELWADLSHPSRWKSSSAALAVRSVRENLPGMNMIYVKAAFDYAIYYRLMEYLSPGYLERYERTMKDKAGIEFWLRPTQVSR